ncbi:MAG: hypothetical protein H7124_09625 [Phycisphaerales bacterium]|nr:hypothetical protein [Hyphomonadaceae bacterium]
MTLEEINYIAQTIGVVAILASLVFVGFQLRQSTEQSKQANALARADMGERTMRTFGDNVRDLMVNNEMAEIFRKAMFEQTDLTPVETTRILFYFSLTLHAHRTAFLQVKDGLIDERVMAVFDQNTAWHLTSPIFAREWRRLQRSGVFGASDFSVHVNTRFAELYPAPATTERAEEAT